MKKTNDKIHFKKIHIKQVKKENPNQDDININNNIQQKHRNCSANSVSYAFKGLI